MGTSDGSWCRGSHCGTAARANGNWAYSIKSTAGMGDRRLGYTQRTSVSRVHAFPEVVLPDNLALSARVKCAWCGGECGVWKAAERRWRVSWPDASNTSRQREGCHGERETAGNGRTDAMGASPEAANQRAQGKRNEVSASRASIGPHSKGGCRHAPRYTGARSRFSGGGDWYSSRGDVDGALSICRTRGIIIFEMILLGGSRGRA